MSIYFFSSISFVILSSLGAANVYASHLETAQPHAPPKLRFVTPSLAESARDAHLDAFSYGRHGDEEKEERGYEKAYALSLEGAKDGDAACMYMLARVLETGLGCEKDPVESDKWLLAAADAEHSEAINEIGNKFLKGEERFPQSDELACSWYKRAAALGNPDAKQSLIEPRFDVFRASELAEIAARAKEARLKALAYDGTEDIAGAKKAASEAYQLSIIAFYNRDPESTAWIERRLNPKSKLEEDPIATEK